MKNKIFFRADGNKQVGLGHLFRSLSLAGMLKSEFDGCFIIKNTLENLFPLILDSASIKQIASELPLKEEPQSLLDNFLLSGDILVLDGYQFDTTYQRILKAAGIKIVCIDDIHAFHFVADAIINLAGGVKSTDYSAEDYTRFLLGPAYCLLRDPFLKSARLPVTNKNLTKLFLNLGGADIGNDTLKILKQLSGFADKFEEINVVVGPAYTYLEDLLFYVQHKPAIKIHQNLSALEMCSLMQNCGVAICPPSGVSYEFCSVRGLLFLYQTAENQNGIKEYLIQNSLALPYQEFASIINSEKLKLDSFHRLIRNQQTIFDGRSPERFLAFFKSLC